MNISPQTVERYWRHVDKRGPDDCWNWTATVDPGSRPYGIFHLPGVDGRQKQYRATHIALALDDRTRPSGLHALHSCDNPRCVNPKHLRWGTRIDNARDAIDRGRVKSGQKPKIAALA